MMRRSFRIGLRLGLLGGIAAAVAKTVQSRRSTSWSAPVDEPAAWPPVQRDVPSTPEPEVAEIQADVEPAAPLKKKAAAPKKAPATKKAAKKAAAPAWVEPVGSVCPPSHPVKAKLASRLYHLPGMFAYARAVPDRCYATPEQAEADGLTRAKR